MFEKLIWLPDRMLLDDLVFRLEHYRSECWDGGDHFRFYKIKSLLDQYELFLKRFPGFSPGHIIELGMYDGGSMVFWFELFKPRKLIGIDLENRTDSPYFQRYIKNYSRKANITTYWNTDQANKGRLREIVSIDLSGYLDCVIDDASHLYEPTKASFETLFPLMAPGGLYIIEDWAWGHWPQYIDPKHPWSKLIPPTRLVTELVEAAGSTNLISSLTVYSGFIVVERGEKVIEDPAHFSLQDHIVNQKDTPPDTLN